MSNVFRDQKLSVVTFPEGMVTHKSIKIGTFGLVGYMKLTFLNSISPYTVFRVVPSLLLESIKGLLSRIPKIEAAESLALLVSGAKAVLWATPSVEIVKAKKTCKITCNIKSY